MRKREIWLSSVLLAMLCAAGWTLAHKTAQDANAATGSTRSSPLAITSDDRFVWSVNPDNDSVSVFEVEGDLNKKVAEIDVGTEPWCVAITPDDAKVYVTNMASGTVSVVNAKTRKVVKTVVVGTEPFGCALTPDGSRLYVANQSSGTVSVLNTKSDVVIKTIKDVGAKPHAIAITAGNNATSAAAGGDDGSSDDESGDSDDESKDGKSKDGKSKDGESGDDENGDGQGGGGQANNDTKIYVTQFLAQTPADDPRPLTQSEGADDGREGRVTVIDGQTNKVIQSIVLGPLADVGAAFRSDGNTLAREPLTTVFDNVVGGFPNLLESITVRGSVAYIPNTCSSPNGPFRFNVNVQSCLSSIDTQEDAEAFPTLNMNVGVNFEPNGTKLFNTNPFAVAFKHEAAEGFVALAATDRLLRVTLDAQGTPTINAPQNAGDPGGIVRIELKDPQEILLADPEGTIGGLNPRGIVINSTDTRAYVMDFISRDVAIVDISGSDPTQYETLARIPSADLPAPGSEEAIVQRGKQLFNTSIGPEGAQANSTRPAGRMSDFGWGTCYSCHPQGLTDSVTWMFADGPRQAISMESTFSFGEAVIANGAPVLPDSHQRALNWSAVRDEVQDFTRNVRAVSGGGGLIRAGVPEGAAGLTQVPDLTPTANTGRSPDLDAIATYLALGVRAPISPIDEKSVKKGRDLFEQAGCQNCHGGPNWTISDLNYTPPADPAAIVDAQLVQFLCRVGTFDPALFADGKSNEIRANNVANVQARGVLGFNVPSLISVFAAAPYLHSGAAPTLADVLANVTHRSAGSGGIDTLTKAQDRKELVEFLQSIDRSTEPFSNVVPPAGACGQAP